MHLAARCLTLRDAADEDRRVEEAPIGPLITVVGSLVILFLFYALFVPHLLSQLEGQFGLFPPIIRWSYSIFHECLGLPGTLILFVVVTRLSCLAIWTGWKNPVYSKETFDCLEGVAILMTGILLVVGLGSLMLPLFCVGKSMG